ncbi:MAG: hypothetical protein EOS23_03715 [Mesorhizobium sp.]|nr:MAG: hypothetical protein EOS23_03715 [Mesorhizobium sp.]
MVHLARGLSELKENQKVEPEVALTVETAEDDVNVLDGVMRRLDEKTVKGNGYVWRFHKNDADDWPSPLHGHDYEQGLKIDAITGNIYDTSTKNHCETLKRRALAILQATLRKSADFKGKVEALIGPENP